jgi:hypothetical protein
VFQAAESLPLILATIIGWLLAPSARLLPAFFGGKVDIVEEGAL